MFCWKVVIIFPYFFVLFKLLLLSSGYLFFIFNANSSSASVNYIIIIIIIVIITIIIKKDYQCKAGRERLIPYQNTDPSQTIPTHRIKEEKRKTAGDKNGASSCSK